MGNLIDPENLIEKYIVQNKWPQCPIEYNTRTMRIFPNMKMFKRKLYVFLQVLGSYIMSLLLKTNSDLRVVLALSLK